MGSGNAGVMLVPVSSDGAAMSSLRFVMREMGNGVYRAESPEIVPLAAGLMLPMMAGTSLLADVLPDVLDDLVRSALVAMKEAAVGVLVAAPVHGFARFIEEGATEITLRVLGLL